ncbi:hypothetical protein VTJ49DRAFT_4617 [Mycothermus thermophilus]|uniref:C2H2-type domain-containing protein n=1 Tax=Humicola insolens TaxID=85995 RepID=A0ABR3V5T6_HUMIN
MSDQNNSQSSFGAQQGNMSFDNSRFGAQQGSIVSSFASQQGNSGLAVGAQQANSGLVFGIPQTNSGAIIGPLPSNNMFAFNAQQGGLSSRGSHHKNRQRKKRRDRGHIKSKCPQQANNSSIETGQAGKPVIIQFNGSKPSSEGIALAERIATGQGAKQRAPRGAQRGAQSRGHGHGRVPSQHSSGQAAQTPMPTGPFGQGGNSFPRPILAAKGHKRGDQRQSGPINRNRCGNYGVSGHEIKQCVIPRADGCVHGCPICNDPSHQYDDCVNHNPVHDAHWPRPVIECRQCFGEFYKDHQGSHYKLQHPGMAPEEPSD